MPPSPPVDCGWGAPGVGAGLVVPGEGAGVVPGDGGEVDGVPPGEVGGFGLGEVGGAALPGAGGGVVPGAVGGVVPGAAGGVVPGAAGGELVPGDGGGDTLPGDAWARSPVIEGLASPVPPSSGAGGIDAVGATALPALLVPVASFESDARRQPLLHRSAIATAPVNTYVLSAGVVMRAAW